MNKFESLSSKKVTDTDLKYLESKIQFTLPDDYKIFLKEYNGATIKRDIYAAFPFVGVRKKETFCRECTVLTKIKQI